MDGDQPAGGRWNFDAENRKRLPKGLTPPERHMVPPNPLTRKVMAEMAARFPDNFGSMAAFNFPTNAEEAEGALDHFITQLLPQFGDWQDFMVSGQPWMWHAHISAAMNIGLLDPLDACRRAEAEYRTGRAPLNAVEGFIRQIIGWREYVRGIYWLKGPDYKHTNALSADRALPWFYWSGETDMACVRDVVAISRDHAYAHHIQRLMVTGNLALLLGVHPDEINDWYMVVYADAFEWVELPNTHGMAIFADGGVMASKPYAASGAYINRMSNYCGGCAYDVKDRLGERACPFNALYWDFLDRNTDTLGGNIRLAMPYRSLAKMDEAERAAINAKATQVRQDMGAVVRNAG
jgi:deoxyribodipyrimidine photolyase-related protein